MNEAMMRFVKEGVGGIFDAFSDGRNLSYVGQMASGLIERIPNLNVRDRAHLWDALMNVARRGKGHAGDELAKALMSHQVYDPLIQACNEAQAAAEARSKAFALADGMRKSRALADPHIFYLASRHQRPAEGHAEYQGKVYVDRMWRSTLAKAGASDEEIALVAKRIASDGILTVQEIIRAPIWFITRPHCKHFLVPLNTEDVLGSSLNEIRMAHPNAMTGEHRSLTDGERYARYKELRDSVVETMKEKTPA